MLRPVMRLSCFHRCSEGKEVLVATLMCGFKKLQRRELENKPVHMSRESLGRTRQHNPMAIKCC